MFDVNVSFGKKIIELKIDKSSLSQKKYLENALIYHFKNVLIRLLERNEDLNKWAFNLKDDGKVLQSRESMKITSKLHIILQEYKDKAKKK